MVAPDGVLRPHWEAFMSGLTALPAEDMAARWERAQRLILENGVTYNVYSDPRGLDRPWPLDPVPLILSDGEWDDLEQGLVQRATLLDLILADLYGSRTLLAEGLLPPSLILSHPGFLRPLSGIVPAGGIHLHFYAAALARSPDGGWRVVSDRGEAPSGAGYALENRTIIARTLPEMLRHRPVEPLTPFFQKMRETLQGLSPRNRDIPRIVLLSPGPYNESFFEHAYLARFLGYTLVEAEDLTVRDERVFLKTLEGLQPVDVILRRTDGPFCDPLELLGESTLGVAGLVQAVRRGTVAVANNLGSGLLESGVMAPFLPALCRRLLDQDLKLPSVPTSWCGDPGERERLRDDLDDLVIKRAHPGRSGADPLFGDMLSAARRDALMAAIGRAPHAFLAQQRLRLSTAPVWTSGRLDPRVLMLRAFVTAHGHGYVAMPGGLTRIAADRDGKIVSMQAGGGSKDTWVLAGDPGRKASARRTVQPPAKLVRGAHDLPSRVADNLFWFGRYVERTEETARLLRSVMSRVGDAAGFGASSELPAALALMGHIHRVPPNAPPEAAAMMIARKSFDASQALGLKANAERVHRMAAMARDRLSLDTWRAVNRLHDELAHVTLDDEPAAEDLVSLLNGVVLACEALNGLAMENMTRGLAWRFVDIGRRLERGLHAIDILANVLPSVGHAGSPALDVLLEVSDSSMTYRSRYLSSPQFAPVLDLLLADESNPRSLAFQNAALGQHMDQVALARRTAFLGPDQRLTVWLTGAVRTADIDILGRADDDGGRRNLATFLEVLRSKLWELSETLTREYFTHAVSRRPGGGTAREPMP
ncbi:MAG: circularly permuted type 2 ATP-grasp protein [Telmatospirillum sp.]|nr:circularly permuted type 2 ATP-grasp protein [Telmatospirillum sp.]